MRSKEIGEKKNKEKMGENKIRDNFIFGNTLKVQGESISDTMEAPPSSALLECSRMDVDLT